MYFVWIGYTEYALVFALYCWKYLCSFYVCSISTTIDQFVRHFEDLSLQFIHFPLDYSLYWHVVKFMVIQTWIFFSYFSPLMNDVCNAFESKIVDLLFVDGFLYGWPRSIRVFCVLVWYPEYWIFTACNWNKLNSISWLTDD